MQHAGLLACVSLEAATAADEEFLFSVFCSEHGASGLAPFLYDVEQQTIAAIHPRAATSVIRVDGEPAGRLIVERTPAGIRLIDIALLPQYRAGGRGAGASVVAELCAEAAACGLAISLRVARDNPHARRFYERFGFRVIGEDDLYFDMEWSGADANRMD